MLYIPWIWTNVLICIHCYSVIQSSSTDLKILCSNYSSFPPLTTTIFFFFFTVSMCVLSCFSHVQLCAMLWTAACQASQSIGFCRQECWSGLTCSPPGDLPDPRIEPPSLTSNLHWQVGSLPPLPPKNFLHPYECMLIHNLYCVCVYFFFL